MGALGDGISRDPIGERGGISLYQLGANDSINKIDFLGLSARFWYRKYPGQAFWDLPETERKKWLQEFKAEYDIMIGKSARANCIPKKLLGVIIANEQIDYTKAERVGEQFGTGMSLGPAQISMITAQNYGLFPNITFPRPPNSDNALDRDMWQYYFLGSYYDRLRSALIRDDSNIEAAAKLMSKYLDTLCSRSKGASISKSFMRDIALGCSTKEFCCSKGDCSMVVDMDVPNCLVQSLAALWNNDVQILTRDNIRIDQQNAFQHALDASKIALMFTIETK